MASTLYVTDYFSVQAQGNDYSGKQGLTTDNAREGYGVSVEGHVRPKTGTIDPEDEATIWDAEMEDFAFMHLWANGAGVVQLIGDGASVCFPVLANVPFKLTGSTFLAAEDDTEITGASAPVLVEITSIILANYDDEEDLEFAVSFVR